MHVQEHVNAAAGHMLDLLRVRGAMGKGKGIIMIFIQKLATLIAGIKYMERYVIGLLASMIHPS